MNGSTNNEFTLSEGSSMTELNASLSETETTVTVSWSGGGQIKPGRRLCFTAKHRLSTALHWYQMLTPYLS